MRTESLKKVQISMVREGMKDTTCKGLKVRSSTELEDQQRESGMASTHIEVTKQL